VTIYGKWTEEWDPEWQSKGNTVKGFAFTHNMAWHQLKGTILLSAPEIQSKNEAKKKWMIGGMLADKWEKVKLSLKPELALQ
jgi:hypothetical protein